MFTKLINQALTKKHINISQIASLLFALLFITSLAITIFILKQYGYGITYNPSISMPKGFYLIVPAKKIQINDIVLFKPPRDIQIFLQDHHWGPKNNLLLKYVIAVPNDQACNHDSAIWINNKKIAPIYSVYAPQQKLPQKNFCGKLAENQYILLSTKVERSFDSRYFGPIDKQNILGKALKL